MTKRKSTTPWFMTHHSPVGTWSSFTFGLPGHGVSIDLEKPQVDETNDLLIAVSRGPGQVKAFPFINGMQETDIESSRESNLHQELPDTIEARWRSIHANQITRRLQAATDVYESEDIEFTVFSPHPELPDPDTGQSLKFASCPGLLMELTIDNTAHDVAAIGFIGLRNREHGRMRPLDWSTDGALCGIGYSNQWAMAAASRKGEVYTIRHNSVAKAVEQGDPLIHMAGREGGIAFNIPPGTKQTLSLAFGFYREGIATEGMPGRYYYTEYFTCVEEVCQYILSEASTIHMLCKEANKKYEAGIEDWKLYEVFSQAIRGYYASSQLLIAESKPYYNVAEGAYLWRNTLDLAADHLPYELWRNPWVVRNILDDFIERYAYRDEVVFPGNPAQTYPGGLSFAHDMGSFTTFAPEGTSGYEMVDAVFYHFMTTEELLNGIYLLGAYALATNDTKWAKKRLTTARALLSSLENRDHYDPALRDGIPKAQTTKCGERGKEITTYDSLDHALASACGNLYIAVKTLCSCVLLRKFFEMNDDKEGAKRASEMARKTATSLLRFYNSQDRHFRANLYEDVQSRLMAAIEPLAVPFFIGLDIADMYPKLKELLVQHVRTCLTPGHGLDSTTGGMRLSSTSSNTWTSKVILCMFTMQEVLGIPMNDYPTIQRELVTWCQESAKLTTISDQILCDRREVIGGHYYPRTITAFLMSDFIENKRLA